MNKMNDIIMQGFADRLTKEAGTLRRGILGGIATGIGAIGAAVPAYYYGKKKTKQRGILNDSLYERAHKQFNPFGKQDEPLSPDKFRTGVFYSFVENEIRRTFEENVKARALPFNYYNMPLTEFLDKETAEAVMTIMREQIYKKFKVRVLFPWEQGVVSLSDLAAYVSSDIRNSNNELKVVLSVPIPDEWHKQKK